MSRKTCAASSRISEDEMIKKVLKLEELLPRSNKRRMPRESAASASKILKQVCNHILVLQKEVDDLSNKLSHQLHYSSPSTSSVEMISNQDVDV
ncbi:Transcription factor PRE5-like protein [Drosera capensis]